jgi:hypothetical protein
MSGEEDMDQTLKSNNTPEDGNENASQELSIEQSKTQSNPRSFLYSRSLC